MNYEQATKIQAARDILQASVDLITPPGSWIQEYFFRRYKGVPSRCSLGAINSTKIASNVSGARYLAERTLLQVINHSEVACSRKDVRNSIIRFNDSYSRSQSHVIAKFHEAIALLDAQLADGRRVLDEANAVVEQCMVVDDRELVVV